MSSPRIPAAAEAVSGGAKAARAAARCRLAALELLASGAGAEVGADPAPAEDAAIARRDGPRTGVAFHLAALGALVERHAGLVDRLLRADSVVSRAAPISR